jgi:hypothetical protein
MLSGLDEHLKRHYQLPMAERKELLASCSKLTLLPPGQVPLEMHAQMLPALPTIFFELIVLRRLSDLY